MISISGNTNRYVKNLEIRGVEMYEKLRALTLIYFSEFENKNIKALEKVFSDNVTLFDPIVKLVTGKEKVLEVNKNIFYDCKEIRFTKKNIFIDESKMTAIGEVEFYCNDTKINVVDIIKFNNNLKIQSITAYLDTGVLNA